jgi:hypothetical protein
MPQDQFSAVLAQGISRHPVPAAVVRPRPWVQRLTVLASTLLLRQAPRRAKGKTVAARGPTAAEFKNFIAGCRKAWDELGEVLPPIFSWDNARIHGNVRDEEDGWGQLGITVQTHTQLPPYSPDMHSVIELSHARLMGEMQKFINDRKSGPDDELPAYTDKLLELFLATITPSWAKATTHRLFIDVLPAVLRGNGDYTPKHLR